jgi:mono/diheme cytochrome c family protein
MRPFAVPAFAVAVIGTLAAAAAIVAAAGQRAGEREDYSSGPYLYRAFCASCHGLTGAGDGPVADLGPRPSDLTRLSATHGNAFPRSGVRAVLEGTRRVAGHATPAMPNWREVLRKVERADDRTIERRIDALVSHVESLQK